MKIKYKNTIKKITAVILAVTMMPISDFGNTVVAGENITNETEEKASPTTVQKGLKDLNITSDLVLDKDMEVNDVIHDRGVIDLNGHVLKINGSYKGQNGIIKINGGSLYCSGNLEISRYQRIIMNNANDYLNVEGSTIIDGSSYYGGDITNGTIETAGDFTINSNLFRPSGYSKIVLSGNHMQTVNINSHAELNIVELKNYSSEGISSASPINCKTLIRNGSILNVCGEEGSYGYTLEEDIIIDGEYVLISDTLNLNGHTMTVKGDFIQMGGCVDVNKGSLIVEGDYRVQSRIKADDEYSYGMSAGILRMADDADHVIVNGNFITSSSCSGREYLTAGTLELKGDFIVNTEYSRYSFTASDTHKVLLSGNGKQTVNFDICYQGCSAIANLEIENHSEEGVVITGKPCVTGNVNDNGCKVTGSIVPDSAVTFTNNTYHGDLYIYSYVNLEGNYNIDGNVYSQSSVTLSGNLNITGDYTETGSGIIRMNGGSLKIGGNFNASTTYNSSESIDMTGETDYILVNGDFTMKSPCRSYRLTNGTLEVKGDFKADAFYAQGSHRVLLSGDGIQHVSLGDNSYFATLEILNHSEEGVYCERAVVKSTLIRNGCRLRYGDTEGEFGWTLSEDYTYEGDLVLIDETLDLNGHTLTVKGDFIQQAGEVKINGGALFTEGSFRMQTRKGSKGDYTYTSGAGILNMTNENDLVIVNGSYINSSAVDHKDYMTAGVLEVKGDFEVNNSGSNSSRNFYSTGSHKVILNGVGTQKIVWAYQNNYTSRIANLEIAGSGLRQINIEGMPYVTGNVNDNNAAITGYIIPGAQTTFSGNSFNGSFRLKEPLNVTGELNIAGDVYNDGGRIVMNGGSLTIGGNYDMYNSSYSYGIEMSHSDDYILVNGNFNFNPYYTSTLSDGILEVKGNFTSTRGFSGCRNHKVILSGSKKQTVNMGSSCTMAVLELNNKSEEGIYAETLIIKDELIRNGCNITYKDAEGEFGWTLSDDEEYDGDLVLVDGTLNLSGHTLTVKGDFIQIGGKADINGGTLIVEGDYRQQNRSGSKGKYTYSQSTAILSMTKPLDTVIIKGDYITNSTADHHSYMTDGLLEVRGNLNVSSNSNYNFYPSDSHTLVLNGSKEQTIKIGIYGWNYSGINNLIINNTSDKKVIFENNIYVRGNVKDISGNVEGNISLTDTTCFENKYFSGGIVVSTGVNFSGKAEVAGNINISSALTISGELTVNGDCEMGSSSALVMNGGTFTILGSLSQSGIYSSGISMTHDSDYITVMKDFSYTPYYNGVFSAGTLEVKGDFHSAQFYASGTHKVILGGDGLQTVDIGSNNYFNIVELKNYSNEGVYSETVFRKNHIIINGCRISYGEGNTVSGCTLSDDYVCEGDFILTDGVMDLNGHTMTVTGDFIESDGELLFNGGKLVIEGDYRLQNRVKSGEEYTYSAGLGKITMNNSEDIMVVNGDFIIEPVSENCCNITAGTLEVKGDVKQNGNYGFNGGQGLTLTLSGTDTQTISSYRMVTLGTIVNNNSSSLIINGELKSFENLTDNGGNISGSGSVSVDRVDKITENKWSGSVKITGENTLISDMNIGGTLYIDGNMNLGGHTLQAGAVNITNQVEMNGGSISCSGSFAVGIYGRLIMNSPEDYILSGGDFSFVSCYSHDGLLSDGTLEIRGNFMQDSYRNFIATANHNVILSRKNSSAGRAFIQSVVFNCYAGDTRFNRLVLKKVASEYQFHNDINLIANEVVYEIDDTVPPTPVTELTATCMSSTKVSLAFGGAADDSGISGYEIYRNGVKTAVTSKTVYADTSVKPGLTYEYKVYPFDIYYNRSEETPTATVTMPEDTESPSEPEGLKMVSRTGSSINISWNPSSDNVRTEGYEIYRNGKKAADCKKNSYKDSGLEKDKSYIYSIRAYDAAGNMSEFSEEITFSTVSPDIKEVYPEDNAIIGGSLIKLQVKFADNGNSTGNKVNIEYKNESGNWVQIPPTHLGQSRYNASTFISSYVWNTEDIKLGEKCEIKYTLYDADGNSDTKTVTYTFDNVPPELPEKFSAKPDNNTIRLKWTPSASADCRSYILLRSEDGKDDYKEIAKLSDRYSDSYTDRNVTEGKQYRYALRVADTFENVSGYIFRRSNSR
ncbi:MAG: hypothetical protein K2I03_04175 [Lachnospiraceae bacterium]|nr:hypothetical protein [Lachnospiraceae bacterium]